MSDVAIVYRGQFTSAIISGRLVTIDQPAAVSNSGA